jgi:hypothetical protein
VGGDEGYVGDDLRGEMGIGCWMVDDMVLG